MKARPRATDAELLDLERWFKGWTVTTEQASRIKRIRSDAMQLARTIVDTVAPGPDRAHAIRFVRDAALVARDSISQEMAGGA
jgi:hypothetical protein